MRRSALSLGVGALAASLLHAGPALALPLETWVSSTGSGTTCSRAAPCATFQIAHDNTAAGGQIGVVDFGDYGPVTISKSIGIVAEGAEASILAPGDGIFVHAGANDVVHIRGLIIDGEGTGAFGILYNTGAALHIENCVIKNFSATGISTGSYGIAFAPITTSPAEFYVSDTVLTNNGSSSDGGGVLIEPIAAAPVRVVLNRVRSNNNFRGIKADGSLLGSPVASIMNINIRDSVFSGSANNGIVATTPSGGGTILLTLDRITSSNNGPSAPASVGVVSDGPSSFIRIGNSTITGNWTGMSASNGGQLISFGNNTIIGNATDGAPTSVATLK